MRVLIPLSILALVTVSCAEAPEVGSIEEWASPLVFNQRNVQSIRGQVLLAGSESGSDRVLDMRAALHARGAGVVKISSINAVMGEDANGEPIVVCQSDQSGVSLGSGTLSTDTVVVTSRHLVGYVSGSECGQAHVSFESNVVSSGSSKGTASGTFAYYSPSVYGDIDVSNEITKVMQPSGSTDPLEENPFLANRLFQLGLDGWAQSRSEAVLVRDQLRDWPFKVLEVQSHNLDPDHASHDVAFLGACNRVIASNTSAGIQGTAGWQNGVPAMFFDRTDFRDRGWFQMDPMVEGGETPLRSVYHASWSQDGRNMQTLVANPGYPDLSQTCLTDAECETNADCTELSEERPFVCDTNEGLCRYAQHFCPDGVTPTVTGLQDCLETSVDAVPGTSGGALLMQPVGELNYVSLGVLEGGADVRDPGAGLPQNWARDGAGMLTPCTVAEPNPNLTDCSTSFSMLNDELAEKANFDVDWSDSNHPFVPRSEQSWLSTPGLPYCQTEEGQADQVCRFRDENGPLSAEEHGEIGLIAIPAPNLEPGGTPLTPDNPDQYGAGPSSIPCSQASFGGNYGLAIGLAGGVLKVDPSPGVGSFYVACAPRYAGSYHLNWRWLWLFGRTVQSAESSLLVASGMLLHRFLRNSFESRKAGAAQGPNQGQEMDFLRPASMKLCPPNHYLNGMRVWKDNSERVYGIQSILCIAHDATTSSSSVEMELDAPRAQFNFTFSSPTVQQAQFSLTQMIGDPTSGVGTTPQTLACPDINGQAAAITAVAFEYENQAILNNLVIQCDTLP